MKIKILSYKIKINTFYENKKKGKTSSSCGFDWRVCGVWLLGDPIEIVYKTLNTS